MKVVVFAGGDLGDFIQIEKYTKDAALVICADSGVRHAFRMNIIPDIIVGDMDSASVEDIKKIEALGIEKYTFSAEKDFTDTELALRLALKKGARQVVLFGGLGSRPDHSLANIFLMVLFKKQGMDVKLVGGNWEMFLIDNKKQFGGKKGDILSLIPITPEVTGIRTEGLYYPLIDETISMGPARGISNVFMGDSATVTIQSGLLLAIKLDGSKID
jgi:thiamine pyrophosphokinase